MIFESFVGIFANSDIRIIKWVFFYLIIITTFLLISCFDEKFPFPSFQSFLKLVTVSSLIIFIFYIFQGFYFENYYASLNQEFGRWKSQDWFWSGSAYTVVPIVIALPTALIRLEFEKSTNSWIISWALITVILIIIVYFQSRIALLCSILILIAYLLYFKKNYIKTTFKNALIIIIMFMTFFIFNRLDWNAYININKMYNKDIISKYYNFPVNNLCLKLMFECLHLSNAFYEVANGEINLNKKNKLNNSNENNLLKKIIQVSQLIKVNAQIKDSNKKIKARDWSSIFISGKKQKDKDKLNNFILKRKSMFKYFLSSNLYSEILQKDLLKNNYDDDFINKEIINSMKPEIHHFIDQINQGKISYINLESQNRSFNVLRFSQDVFSEAKLHSLGLLRDINYSTQALTIKEGSDLNRQIQLKAAFIRLTNNFKTFLFGDGIYSHRYTIVPTIKKLLMENKKQMSQYDGSIIPGSRNDGELNFSIFRTNGFSALLIDTGIIGIILFSLLFLIPVCKIIEYDFRNIFKLNIKPYGFFVPAILLLCFCWFLAINVTEIMLIYLLILPNGILFNLNKLLKEHLFK